MNSRRPGTTIPAMTSVSGIEDLLCFDLYAASRAMTALYRPLLAPLGLTYPQYLVLQVLHRRGDCTVGELGEVLRLDYGTTTPLLRRLEAAGLVTRVRQGDDQRSVLLGLTDRGRGLGPDLEQVRCGIGEALGMTETEVDVLQRTLRRLTDEITT